MADVESSKVVAATPTIGQTTKSEVVVVAVVVLVFVVVVMTLKCL
jgi:hypothetical protein